ncbi:MAG: PIN domain-containing protein [Deltaproteobacteria bacterium]|nr:PIN domain-containing protein [Deltaproteobacteria bacterium]
MRFVLDTNILIAALIKNSLTRQILLHPDIEFVVPEHALEEIERHMSRIVKCARMDREEVELLLSILLESVTVIPFEEIAGSIDKAGEMIGAFDPDDVPFVALALAVENDGIWSNDGAFENLKKIRVWRTSDMREYFLDN